MANTKITPHVLDSTLISGHSTVTAATNDFVLIQDVSDSGALKKALVSDLAQNEESPTFTGNVSVGGTLSVTGATGLTDTLTITKTGTDDAGILLATANANRYFASDENGVVGIGTGTTLTGGTRYLTIDGGNVGIGDTSPFAKLHVEDTGWSSGAPYGTVAYIQGGATNDANWGHLLLSQSGTTTDTGGRLAFGANGENPIAGIRAKYKGATYGDLAFSTRPSGGTNTERMVIDSSGNVGILASTPSRILDVQLTATNGSLHDNNNAAAHFGSGTGNANSDGYIQGISLGYKTTGANTYAKVAIVARGLNDGAGRQSLAFLVDTDADGGSAEIGNAKLTIHGTTGNVGIGMPAPNANLEVFDASGGAGTGVRINCNNGGSDVWDLYSTTAGRLYVKNPNYSGGVYIQHSATSWTSNSDENLKENITSLGTVGDKLKNYRTSYFTWKDDNREKPKRQIGFIAQDWESDFPEVVNKVEGEPLGMQYTETIPVLLKAIQEQQTIIEDLKTRIETLEG